LQALDAYLADEVVEDFKPAPVTKSTRLTHLPTVLVLHLKRFEGRPRKPAGGKLDKFVDYTLELQLGGVKYAAFAQVLHSGGPLSGHYTALARTRDAWYYLDDSTSVRVSNLNSLIRKECYVLLYVRQA
jgi:ubiquitin C-terminal hydrolase